MKISFITTILNEGKSITKLLESLDHQVLKPDEIIIVDGGSTDNVLSVISNFQFPISNGVKVRVLLKRGNRSVGRNEAIKNATGDIIVCSDAGCELDRNWVKNITKPFQDPKLDVVTGYYKGITKSIFQKCLVPYILVMPDRIDPDNFLPATRSMSFRKSVWKKVGGFDEKLSHNEDYAFAKKIKKNKYRIVFAKDAIAYWQPPDNLLKTFIMFFRFAYGDAESEIFRPKALFVIVRYLIGVLFIIMAIINHSISMFGIIVLILISYVLWSIVKNYKYIKDLKAIILLPVIQFTSDFAVIFGTLLGVIKYGI